ncbi:MAG: hypothetical protein AB7G05_08845 [Hyphomonadaceae bacterium]
MMEPEIFVPFTFFAFLAAVIIIPIMLKERTKRSAHDLVGKAIERGQTVDPVLIQQLTENLATEGNRARKSLGNGVVLIALSVGFAGAAYAADGFGNFDTGALVPAIITGAVGVAFLLLAIIDYAGKKRA